jgi:hypothetical protein
MAETSASTQPQLDKTPIFKDAAYKPALDNWYTSKPYGFRFTSRAGEQLVMYLPISPSNLNIVTHFATNLIPTIYGSVEEHSPVRYFDITIEGTTGMAPKYITPEDAKKTQTAKPGRSTFPIQKTLGIGLFTKTVNAIQNIANSASALISGGQPSVPKTGIKLDHTGYSAFHNLYRFLLAYKKDVTEKTEKYDEKKGSPLVFFNYKDGNEYSVVVKNFILRRDKDNPMLYYYSIVMRGYNLTQANENGFKADTSDQILAALGLDGVKGSTYLGMVKNAASLAKDIVASVTNGVSQLGR